MADDSWDSPNFEAPALNLGTSTWGNEEDIDDVKDNWDDPDKEPEKPPEKAETKTESKSKAVKVKNKRLLNKSKDESADPSQSYGTELTGKELEDLQKKRDIELIGDMLGHSEDDTTLLTFQTEEESKNCADKLGEKLKQCQNLDHYKEFLSQLFYKLCSDMDAVSVRKLGGELTALGNNIQETARKAKQEKEKKKQKLLVKRTNILDDVLDAEEGGGYGYGMDDDEDFI